jgi:hypothetical protein
MRSYTCSRPDVNGVCYPKTFLNGNWSIIIYPNPAYDMLSIEIACTQNNSTASYEILLFNSQGNLLRRAQAKENIVQFDVSALPGGIYFLHISNGISAISETHKVIVKH